MTQNEQPAEKRPTFWMWGDPITCRNPIRELWEATQLAKAEPMSEEAKERCAEFRREKQERRKLRRRGR